MQMHVWSEEEDALLLDWTEEGRTAQQIATELGRTVSAVATRRRDRCKGYVAEPKATQPMASRDERIQQLLATIAWETSRSRPRTALLRALRTGLLRFIQERNYPTTPDTLLKARKMAVRGPSGRIQP